MLLHYFQDFNHKKYLAEPNFSANQLFLSPLHFDI